jgi:Ca2+-binding EF-hand superfamily protein
LCTSGVSAADAINKRLDELERTRRRPSPPRASSSAYKPFLASTCEDHGGEDAFTADIHRRLDMLGSAPRRSAASPAAAEPITVTETSEPVKLIKEEVVEVCAKGPEPAEEPVIKTKEAVKSSGAGLKFKPQEVDPESMENYLKGLFEIGDTNGDGVLQPAELANLLKLTGFNLDAGTILDVVASADVDGDGLIQYEEFVPVVRDMLSQSVMREGPAGANPNLDFKQLNSDELENYLSQLFKISDANGDGVLQIAEYVQLMRLSGLKFSDDIILQGITDADSNKDGVIDYQELVAYFKRILA